MTHSSCTASLTLSFAATEHDACTGLERAIEWLAASGLERTPLGSIQIALTEAVNNVVEHGYAGAEPGPITMRLGLTGTGLLAEISDEGQPMPDNELPPGDPADLTVERMDLPEGGFGWFLIRQLTCALGYVRTGNINRLTLTFDLVALSD